MKHLVTALLFVVVLVQAQAQTTYFNKKGVAIRGYDPVAYFSENKPVEGSQDFSYKWQGTEWRFKDKSNMELFKSNPEKYAPQFGGYCAYGVSENHKSPTEPEAFTIVGDKLYLNYNVEVRELWRKDKDGHIKKGETNWVQLKTSKD
jgi:hypothetical protein